jgi:hypothetical protein
VNLPYFNTTLVSVPRVKEYIAIPCSVEAPQRLYNPNKCANKDDFTFAKCIINKKEALEADYSRLLNAFEACKL